MGKKGFKLKVHLSYQSVIKSNLTSHKQYKAPRTKYLVVVNPWGIYGNFDAADLNHIGAWFEVMLRDEYPTARVIAVYYQRTVC
jgi:hypothetical protein